MGKWVVKQTNTDVNLMSKTLNLDLILCRLLANRNINTKNKIYKFLNSDYSNYNDFSKAKNVEMAYNVIKKSISLKEKIIIYGDYDVDGVMSTTILYKGLVQLGANVSYYIPHREFEGYGLNFDAIKKIKEAEVDLIITCDNGITALEEAFLIREYGMKLVIIDHHEPSFVLGDTGEKIAVLPVANAIVNPKQIDCNFEFKHMCAAGLCFRFIQYYFEMEDKEFILHDELIIFAMIATFCDVVDLKEDNRIICAKGLKLINSSENNNIGLKKLIKLKSIDGVNLNSYEIGFIIGPCINASGRLKRATIAVELFTTDSEDTAQEAAEHLVYLNEERKTLTKEAFESSLKILENEDIINDKIFVIFNEDMHESIAGIVAGRIKEKFQHPTIVFTEAEEGIKGSARSIEAYNIFEALRECQTFFTRFGGHAMAAGISMEKEDLENFRAYINQECQLVEEDFEEIIRIDCPLELEEVSYKLYDEISKLQPFGKDNKEPLFGTKGVVVKEIRIIEPKNTIIFTFAVGDSYRTIKGLLFGKVDEFREECINIYGSYITEKIFSGNIRNVELKLDLVYYIDLNVYNNNVSVQMKIKDFRFSQN